MGAGGALIAEGEVGVVENVQGASAVPDGQRVQPRGSQEAEIGSTLCGGQGAFGQVQRGWRSSNGFRGVVVIIQEPRYIRK